MKKNDRYFEELEKLLHEHDLKSVYLNAVNRKDADQRLLILAASIRTINPALFESDKTSDEYANLTGILRDIEKVVQGTAPRHPHGIQEHNETSPAGTFQKYFKELVKTQGARASSEHTARYLLDTMSAPQLTKLRQALDSVGVHTREDFNRLLDKWKDEALRPPAPQQQRELPVRRDKALNR
jgi:hypothetical protein